MKVGMLTTWKTRCGIAAYTGDLVTALCKRAGIDVEVVPITTGIQEDSHYAEQAERLNRCDVVHIQHEYSFWGGYVPGKNRFHAVRRLIRRPVVLTAHTTTPLETLIVPPERNPGFSTAYRRIRMKLLLPILLKSKAYRRWIEVSAFESADHVIAHTGEGLETLAGRGIGREKLHLLPAGIPEALPAADQGKGFRNRFGLDGRRLVTLFGYVTPFKGYELMLESLRALPGDVAFVIAGGARTPNDEPYVAELRRRIAEAGMDGRAVITGFLPDEEIAGAMAAAEVVVVPHTQATGSYSVTAPLAYAKPILASDLACFREIADRGDSIRLFPAGKSARLTESLKDLLADPAARSELSERSAEYARHHSWHAVAQDTADIYRKALESPNKLQSN